jgi:hypothetical protein
MIADRARLCTMLASLARTLHVSVLADCFFDPGSAMCLKQATNVDSKLPLTALCQPTRCPNACITARHWDNGLERLRWRCSSLVERKKVIQTAAGSTEE